MHRTGLEYYSGDDGENFNWLVAGASGLISVVAHVAAAQYRRMIDLLDDNQVWEAREIHFELRPLVDAIMGGGQGTVMAKVALALQGIIDTPAVRLPLVPTSDEELTRLRQVMERMNLL